MFFNPNMQYVMAPFEAIGYLAAGVIQQPDMPVSARASCICFQTFASSC